MSSGIYKTSCRWKRRIDLFVWSCSGLALVWIIFEKNGWEMYFVRRTRLFFCWVLWEQEMSKPYLFLRIVKIVKMETRKIITGSESVSATVMKLMALSEGLITMSSRSWRLLQNGKALFLVIIIILIPKWLSGEKNMNSPSCFFRHVVITVCVCNISAVIIVSSYYYYRFPFNPDLLTQRTMLRLSISSVKTTSLI